jgi:hypothetical protein
MHLAHNSAKLKIFNLPKHIQLLRWGLAASAGQVGRLPSDPLVGELFWLTDQRSDGVQTSNGGSIVAEPPFSQRFVSSLVGASGPGIHFGSLCVGGS